MTLTITHHGNVSASGIAGGLPDIASKTTGEGLNAGNVFSSLLSTLFSLTAPEGQSAQPTQITEENLDALSEALLTLQQNLNATGETDVSLDAETPATAPLELIANLIESLNTIASVVESGATPNPGAIASASTAIDTITNLLNTAAANQQSLANPLPANASIANTPANIANAPAVLATGDANTTQQPTSPPAPPPTAAFELAQLANKLQQTAPELSAKLTQLADTLKQFAAATGAQTTIAASATSASTLGATDPNLNQLLQSLIGEKQVTGPKSNLPTQSEKPIALGLDTSAQKSASPLETPKLDLSATKIVASDARPQNAEPAARPNAPATALAGAAATQAGLVAKPERGPQSDPLLLAQANTPLSARADSSIAIKPAASAYQAQTQTPNLPNLAFEIARQSAAGLSKFQIRMDPPEMGKIDVRLNMDGAGNVHARLTVERAETLDLLQRDARTLEKALQQAGLEGRSTNLEFSMRQNPFAGQNGQSGDNNSGDAPIFSLDDDADAPLVDLPQAIYYRGTASPGGVNMFA